MERSLVDHLDREQVENALKRRKRRNQWIMILLLLVIVIGGGVGFALKYTGRALNNEGSEVSVYEVNPNAYELQEDDISHMVLAVLEEGSNAWVTKIEYPEIAGNVNPDEKITFKPGEEVKLSVDYHVDEEIFKSKDFITYTLPKNIVIENFTEGVMYETIISDDGSFTSQKREIGNISVDKNNVVTMVFLPEFKEQYKKDALASFSVQAKIGKVEDGNKTEFQFVGMGSVAIEVQNESDLSISKNGSYNRNSEEITYTLTASTNKGSVGKITLEDTFANNPSTPDAKITEISISKFSANGTEAIVEAGQYQLTGGSNCNYFKMENLPELGPGERYVVTYKVKPGQVVYGTDGVSAELKNYAVGGDHGIPTNPQIHTTDLSKSKPSKNYAYAVNDEYVWEIHVTNITGDKLDGKVVEDYLPDGLVYVPGSLTVNWQSPEQDFVVSEDGKTLTYAFPANSTAERYTLIYRTKIVDAQKGQTYSFVNKGKFNEIEFSATSPSQEYNSPTDYDQTYPGWVKKEYKEAKPLDENASIERVKWDVTVSCADDGSHETIIKDVICDAVETSNYGVQADSHYTTVEEIASLASRFESAGYVVETHIYSDTEFYNEIADGVGKVRSFSIHLRKPDGYKFEKDEQLSYYYYTYVDVSKMTPGEAWRYTNEVRYDKQISQGVYEKRLKQNINKLVEGDDGAYGNHVRVEYGDGVLHYAVILRFNGNESGDIVLTDSMDSDMELVDDSVDAFYWRWNNAYDKNLSNELKQFSSSHKEIPDFYVDENGATVEFARIYSAYKENEKETGYKLKVETSKDENDKSQVKLVIKDYPKGYYDFPIVITYDVKLTGDEWNRQESIIKTKGNSISWEEHGTGDNLVTVVKHSEAVEKHVKVDANNKDIIHYAVDINREGLDLDPYKDTISLTDDFAVYSGNQKVEDVYAFLEVGDVKLYTYDSYYEFDEHGRRIKDENGEYKLSKNKVEVSKEQYKFAYDDKNHQIKLIVPDRFPCVFEYDYLLLPGGKDYVSLEVRNRIALRGETSGSDTIQHWKAELVAGSYSDIRAYLVKVDKDDNSIVLPNVSFKLYRWDGNTWQSALKNSHDVLKTNANGVIDLSDFMRYQKDNKVAYYVDTLFKLEEIETAANYEKKDFYFVCSSTGNLNNVSNLGAANAPVEEISILAKNGGVIYAQNQYKALTVTKQWLNYDGAEMNAPQNTEIAVELHRKPLKTCKVTVMQPNAYNGEILGEYEVYQGSTFHMKVYNNRNELYTCSVISKETNQVQRYEQIGIDEMDFDLEKDPGKDWCLAHILEAKVKEDCVIKIDKYVQSYKEPTWNQPNPEDVVLYTVVLNENNDWTHTWEGLDQAMDYYVVEKSNISGWTPSYINNEGVTNGTITIRNTKEREFLLPSTGGTGTRPYTVGGLAVIAVGLLYGFVLKRKRGKAVNR